MCSFEFKPTNATTRHLQLQTKKLECPLKGKCLQTKFIYQATVVTETTTEIYIGLASKLKERYQKH